MGNISLQLVPQHCCSSSCKALLPILPPPQATCCATNFSVASCSNMLPKVDPSSTSCNMLLQLTTLKFVVREVALAGVVIWATKLCNFQSNNVVPQAARKCCLYYLTFMFSGQTCNTPVIQKVVGSHPVQSLNFSGHFSSSIMAAFASFIT